MFRAPWSAAEAARSVIMRGSGLIWTIVGVLLIIVLIVWLMGAL